MYHASHSSGPLRSCRIYVINGRFLFSSGVGFGGFRISHLWLWRIFSLSFVPLLLSQGHLLRDPVFKCSCGRFKGLGFRGLGFRVKGCQASWMAG